MLTELNNENFDSQIKDGLKLVEFHTTWCGYCRKQKPELEAMDKVWIGQVDAEKSRTVASKYGISGFPTFLVFKNGKEIDRFSGFRKKEELMSRIMKFI
ncbi:thioredoxin family protein [bacterium]|nr:thioredoxin family protein [bacterium]